MSSEFQKAMQASAEEIAAKMDAVIETFFGSPEAVSQFGHLYVLEQAPMMIETSRQPEFTGDYFKVRTETKYRIRPKTAAELEEDSRD